MILEDGTGGAILDAVAFVRAALAEDAAAMDALVEHADPNAMLLALSALMMDTIPDDLPALLDSWHQRGLRLVLKDKSD